MIWLEGLVGCVLWAGFWLIIDRLSRRGRRPDLADQLVPFQPTVADEAQEWLQRQ